MVLNIEGNGLISEEDSEGANVLYIPQTSSPPRFGLRWI